jgi:predicted nucleic acid-binding protein
MILVDTSIWIDHINDGPDQSLVHLLDGASVVMHDFVIGEIAMGSLKNRRKQLDFLHDLQRVPNASDSEVRQLVEGKLLHGSGLSYIDAHLLAAALIAPEKRPVRIWTRDKALVGFTEKLGVAYQP